MVSALLNSPSNLYYAGCEEGIQIIESEEGVPQGDPDSPLLFSLAKQELTNKASPLLPSGFMIDYLDDGG